MSIENTSDLHGSSRMCTGVLQIRAFLFRENPNTYKYVERCVQNGELTDRNFAKIF